jgi:two-component system sensor histidine kinase and response regulator WspE
MIGGDPSMVELFREEARANADTLSRDLIEVEADPANPAKIEPVMRAAHSIKGAARIVGIDLAVRLAHVMEDALVAAQRGHIRLTPSDIDVLLRGADILATLGEIAPETSAAWEATHAPAVDALEPLFAAMARGTQAAQGAHARVAAESEAPAAVTGSEPTDDFPPIPPVDPVAISPDPLPLPAEHSMLDRFREELRFHLLLLDGGDVPRSLDALKQIRGAARIVKCAPVEATAVAVTGFLSAVGEGRVEATPLARHWLQFAAATLARAIATDDETFAGWVTDATPVLDEIARVFERPRASRTPIARVEPGTAMPLPPSPPSEDGLPRAGTTPEPAAPPVAHADAPSPDAVVRVTAQSLNRLMGLAGESLVQARWLPSFSAALFALKKHHDLLAASLDSALQATAGAASNDQIASLVHDARRQAAACLAELGDQSSDFDDHASRAEDLNGRLYREVILSRMRPFADGVHGLPRLVRDMARALGKEVRLVIEGEQTEVDRDILEKLESPLSHLIRNAVDHGIEPPALRREAGKPVVGTIRLEARHRAGMLLVTVAEDGTGVDLGTLRRKIVDRGLNSAEMVSRMSEAELLEFLFLPGFTTAPGVTEFSGRGIGLDVVQDTIRKVGGGVRITTQRGRGTTFHLQLPLTLSVIRAVVVDVAGEPYAFPHTRIDRLVRLPRCEVRSLEHRQFATIDGQHVGLVVAAQLLDLPVTPQHGQDLGVVILSDTTGTYGLVVDTFRGEQDLVVRPLDARLGKVPNLSAAAILDDGTPVLIVDPDDMLRSMDQYIQTGALSRCDTRSAAPARKKRVLVVDDSITVREVERQLLLHKGYDVAVAVDGVDGWNKVRSGKFDLLVSDIDMPRMTGLQLISAVRGDEKLRDLPVVIVSYKEREEDRLKGLDVGANYYLTKSSFHDNRFIEAVEDLIGPP